jgi:hypothetical protein
MSTGTIPNAELQQRPLEDHELEIASGSFGSAEHDVFVQIIRIFGGPDCPPGQVNTGDQSVRQPVCVPRPD